MDWIKVPVGLSPSLLISPRKVNFLCGQSNVYSTLLYSAKASNHTSTMRILVAQASYVYRWSQNVIEFIFCGGIVYIDGNDAEVLMGTLVCLRFHCRIIGICIGLQAQISHSSAVLLIKFSPVYSYSYRFVQRFIRGPSAWTWISCLHIFQNLRPSLRLSWWVGLVSCREGHKFTYLS